LCGVWSLFKEISKAAIIHCEAIIVSCLPLSYAGNAVAVIGLYLQLKRSEK